MCWTVHCQCQKEMDDHLLACQQFLKENHIVTRLANERASFLNMKDINNILVFGTSDCYHGFCNNVSVNANSMDVTVDLRV
jgi:hypothetical protein